MITQSDLLCHYSAGALSAKHVWESTARVAPVSITGSQIGHTDSASAWPMFLISSRATMQTNLVKQLAKLLKVRYVEDITASNRVGVLASFH